MTYGSPENMAGKIIKSPVLSPSIDWNEIIYYAFNWFNLKFEYFKKNGKSMFYEEIKQGNNLPYHLLHLRLYQF